MPTASRCLANLLQGTVCKILDQEEVRPHKVRYYPEQRDPNQEPVVHTWTHKLDKAA